MKRIPWILFALAVAGAVLAAGAAGAAMVQQMGLDTMTDNALMAFTGRVIGVEVVSVSAGGAVFPATEYTFEVSDLFKGTITTEKDKLFYRMRMPGDVKAGALTRKGDVGKVNILPEPPQLRLGQSYLILATAPSAIGLSVPVGLVQGCFTLYEENKVLMAVNEVGNAGLFPGPVAYDELVRAIRAELGN